MSKKINYPIKYAILELKERGGWAVGYKNITQGFIVSKCYVIESNVIYNPDGNYKLIHKVVFPFRDIETFKNSLRVGKQNIGMADMPKYDVYGNVFPTNEVTELFDSYGLAKKVATTKNEEFKANLLFNMPASPNFDYSNKSLKEQYEILKHNFEQTLAICNLFEQLVLSATEDMNISEKLATEKQNLSIKVLKL